MKTAFVVSTLLVGASAFGVVPQGTSRFNTALRPALPEEDMTADQLEIQKIKKKWGEARLMDREEAEKTLDEEWLEAYNRFYKKYDEDMEKMLEIAGKVEKLISPVQVAKKTKGQRKRDAYAKVQAREAARAAKKK